MFPCTKFLGPGALAPRRHVRRPRPLRRPPRHRADGSPTDDSKFKNNKLLPLIYFLFFIYFSYAGAFASGRSAPSAASEETFWPTPLSAASDGRSSSGSSRVAM